MSYARDEDLTGENRVSREGLEEFLSNYFRSGFSVVSRSGPTAKMAECRGLAPLARGHALVSTEARLACPVDIPLSIVLVLFLVLVIDSRRSRTRTRTTTRAITNLVRVAGLAPATFPF